MKAVLSVGVCIVVGLALTSCGGGSTTTVVSTTTTGLITTTPTTTSTPATTSTSASPPTASDIDTRLASCDDSGHQLVGSARVTNNGDAPLAATVSFQWQLGDGSYVDADQDQQVELQPGQNKLVFFSTNASIGLISKFQDNPGYMNSKNCKITAKLTPPGSESSATTTQAAPTTLDTRLASCDDSGHQLVGSARVTNNGDAPLAATVSFQWQLGDGSYVDADQDQQVELQPGQNKLVFFSTNASIGLISKFQDNPGYMNSKNCEITVKPTS